MHRGIYEISPFTSFCVVFSLSTLYFWLAGKTETKQVVKRMSKWVEGGGSWKGHESAQAVFIFLAALPLVCARFARGFAASPLSGAPDKTAMLRRLDADTALNSKQATHKNVSKIHLLLSKLLTLFK